MTVRWSTSPDKIRKMSNQMRCKEKIDQLLQWIMSHANKYPGVNVSNFTSSWADGKALYALMNSLLGDDVIDRKDMSEDKRANFTKAIQAATKAGVPELLDVSDLCDYPIERLCMITYLHTIYKILHIQRERRKQLNDQPIEMESPFTRSDEDEE